MLARSLRNQSEPAHDAENTYHAPALGESASAGYGRFLVLQNELEIVQVCLLLIPQHARHDRVGKLEEAPGLSFRHQVEASTITLRREGRAKAYVRGANPGLLLVEVWWLKFGYR